MTIQNVTVVFLRLISVHTLLMGISHCLLALGLSSVTNPNHYWMMGLMGFIVILISTAIWKTAPWLSKRVCHGYDSELHIEGLNLKRLYALVILGVGLFVFVENFGGSLYWLYQLFTLSLANEAIKESLNYFDALNALIPCLLGALAVIFCRRWAEKLTPEKSTETAETSS